MTPPEIEDLLQELSKSVQDIGRNIGGKNKTPDDLKKLADALRYSAQTVDIVRTALLEHYAQS